tara:strand:- start:442 stop:630 length:189 start_codon:yes stop_codon:yes gene_type:complete
MSKMGTLVLQLSEDAADMTRDEFIKKHGLTQVDVWDNNERASKIEDELTPSANEIMRELSNA